ncbi:SET domain and MYND-type zinc finger protein 6 [Fulvia fulva]|nr:SET domain and MYND-type zinc finger protein 6 [Fulvia fulva]
MDVLVKTSDITGGGRGLFAKKDFAAGDLILSLDRPYVAELDIERLKDTCAWCLQRGATDDFERQRRAALGNFTNSIIDTKACTGCKRVRYCSKSCQSKAWKREHKYECKVLAPDNRPDLPHGVRAVVKLLGRMKNDPEGKDEALLDILQFWPAGVADKSALDEFKKQNQHRYEDFGMLAYGSWKYAGEPNMGGTESEAIAKGLFFNVMSNTVQLSNPLDDTSLGMGFDPIMCSANHSCDPNAAALFNQPRQILRALKPIKKGEELFMKYTDVSNPLCVRQAELKGYYFFTCQCPRCKQGPIFAEDTFLKPPEQLKSEFATIADSVLIPWHEKSLAAFSVPSSDPTAGRRMAALQAEAFSVSGLSEDLNRGNTDDGEDEVKDALKLCLNSEMWSYTRQPVPHLIRQLLVIYLSQGRMYAAWRLGAFRHFLIAPDLYPQPFYPDRVIDCWLMATVTNTLCNPNIPSHKEIFEQCLQSGFDLRIVYFGFLLETREQIEKSYGRDSPFGRLVETVYQQTVQNTDISLTQIKEKIKENWPKLEAVAKNVDVLKL